MLYLFKPTATPSLPFYIKMTEFIQPYNCIQIALL